MDNKTEGARDLAFLLSEGNGHISRDVVTIKSGAGKLEPGTVLGQITTGGKYVISANAEVVGSEGAETAKAILAYGIDATSADVQAVVIRRFAEVKKPLLVFDASVSDATKIATKLGQLAAQNIIAR
ncbi:MAG: head decoration protein [Xanthobacteraceae bacterium]